MHKSEKPWVKTVTDQTFGRRRACVSNMALACIHMPENEAHPDLPDRSGRVVACVGINPATDLPVWSDWETRERYDHLRFVSSEADLRPGTWTWKEIV